MNYKELLSAIGSAACCTAVKSNLTGLRKLTPRANVTCLVYTVILIARCQLSSDAGSAQAIHKNNWPLLTITAAPDTSTLPTSLSTSSHKLPPRFEHCLAFKCALPSTSAQYDAMTECAAPESRATHSLKADLGAVQGGTVLYCCACLRTKQPAHHLASPGSQQQ